MEREWLIVVCLRVHSNWFSWFRNTTSVIIHGNPSKSFGTSKIRRIDIYKCNYAIIRLLPFQENVDSPFEGMKVESWHVIQFLRGKVIYEEGEIKEKTGIRGILKRKESP
jgi:hypothetical protein